MTPFTLPIPTYQCHKRVRALRIKAVVTNPRGYELHFEDERFCPIQVDECWVIAKGAREGGYVVWYDPDGYMSWSPAAAFEAGYTLVETADGAVRSMDFGDAIRALKAGKRVARAGWNGKGMWLSLSCDGSRRVPYQSFWSPHNAEHAKQQGGYATVLPSITMKTATGEILMGWLASQSDMLAGDWVVVEAKADEVLPVGPSTQAAREEPEPTGWQRELAGLRYAEHIRGLFEYLSEPWVDESVKVQAARIILRKLGKTFKDLDDEIQVGVDKGYSPEHQMEMAWELLAALEAGK